jgi:peptidoglycan/LPS O-acetylase OafA/YrhL
VDLFFAISGFVITRTLLPKLESATGRAEFFTETFAFWIRRAYRLLPSAWLWLFIPLLLVITFNDQGIFGTFEDNWKSTVASLLNVMNFYFAATFGSGGQISNFVYWSLSLEEQFYLLLPFLILLSGRWFPQVTLVVFLCMIVTPVEGWGMPFRTHAILGGVLLAIWSGQPSHRRAEPSALGRNALAKYGSVLLLLMLLFKLGAEAPLITKWNISAIAAVSIVLVHIASYDRDYIIPTNPRLRKIALWFGSRSYAIYLTHIPCFFFSRELFLRLLEAYPELGIFHHAGPLILAPLLVLITSDLNYRLVESPLRATGARVARALRERRNHAAAPS